MYRGVEVFKLLPDRPGRGGAKFGYHSFQQEPINDTRDVKNVHVWQDSWRSDVAPATPGAGYVYPDDQTADPGEKWSLALHAYSKYSLTDPTAGPTTELLGHNASTVGGVTSGHIWNYTTFIDGTFGGGVWTGTTHRIAWCSATNPATFLNVNNRCFIATGDTEGIIYDSSHGSPRFGATGTPSVYTIGVEAPTAAPVVSASDVTTQTAVWTRKGSKYLTWPDPNGGLSTATAPGTDTLILTSDGRTWDSGPPDLRFNIVTKTTTFSTTGKTASMASGDQTVTITGALPAGSAWVGLSFTLAGETRTVMVMGNDPQAGDPTLTAQQIYLSDTIDTPEGVAIVNQPFTVTGVQWTMQRGGVDVTWPGGILIADNTEVGQLLNAGGRLTWDTTPPSYAYAWYDPVTGHVSNISPVFSPAKTSVTDNGVRVPVDVGNISYPASTSSHPSGTTRWTHILFFRTLMAGGSTLYPIGSLDPTSTAWKGLPNTIVTTIPPATTGNYWYDDARDADLLISGSLRAPLFTNGKPKITQNGVTEVLWPAHMAYWDGRIWMAATQDPSAIHYSCDRVQCPFGIPEESYPDTNVLRIPAADGCVRGMKLIGESLLVTTERWAYTVVGNNESNYRLVRISTRMAGVGDYQMDEFVADVEGGGALVVFVGTDSKIYAMPLGGQAVWISKEIQSYLDTSALYWRLNYRLIRVHCTTIAGRRLAIVYIPQAGQAAGRVFTYDFDQKTWTWHTLRSNTTSAETGMTASFVTSSNVNAQVVELYALKDQDVTPPISPNPYVTVWQWFQSDATQPVPSGYVRTFPLTFDGKKTRKRIHFVRIYVNDKSFESTALVPPFNTLYPWRCSLYVDSATVPITASFVNEYDPVYDSLRGGTPVDSADAAELIATDAKFTGGLQPIYGYTFDIALLFPDQSNKIYRCYRMDIGWSTLSEDQVDL